MKPKLRRSLEKKQVGMDGNKDQENPNFSAFDTCESLTNNPVFEPGRLRKYPDGTEIKKI